MQQDKSCQVNAYQRRLISFTQKGRSWVLLRRDEALGDKSDDDATARKVAELGLAGWQLVGATMPGGRDDRGILYFQRSIP